MADMSAENARPGSTTASALNSKDTSRAATPSNAAAEKVPEDGSKFKTLLGILRKYVFSPRSHVAIRSSLCCARRRLKELTRFCCRFIGVSDLASVRFSLPAQLLEPRPNLGTFDTYGLRRLYGEVKLGKAWSDGSQSTGTIWTGQTRSLGQRNLKYACWEREC
jgi:hypothetical protein